MMIRQLRERRKLFGKTLEALSTLTGIARPRLSSVLSENSKVDPRVSTVEAIAAGLDSEWVLIPRHLMPEVNRLLSGKAIAPDNVPSAMERLLG